MEMQGTPALSQIARSPPMVKRPLRSPEAVMYKGLGLCSVVCSSGPMYPKRRLSRRADGVMRGPLSSIGKTVEDGDHGRHSITDKSNGTTKLYHSQEKSVGNSHGLLNTLQLGALFVLWYFFNINISIHNKQVFKVFPFPMTITALHFGVGSVLVLLMWTSNLYKKPKISSSQLLAILPLAIVHTLGNLFTNISLGKVAVSFTHTIKASEPFFSVLLSALFLGELPSLGVVLSLIPIVGGVALASLTEVSFNWAGFWSAMASNVTNQSRNVFSKKFMIRKQESLDNITLFSVISIMSFLLLTPVALLVEGIKLTPSYLQSSGLNTSEIYMKSLMAGLCFHLYQQVSYMILARVSPVTHSVGNSVKRVVVIVATIFFFRTPLSPVNSLGTGIALAGVFLFSRARRIK